MNPFSIPNAHAFMSLFFACSRRINSNAASKCTERGKITTAGIINCIRERTIEPDLQDMLIAHRYICHWIIFSCTFDLKLLIYTIDGNYVLPSRLCVGLQVERKRMSTYLKLITRFLSPFSAIFNAIRWDILAISCFFQFPCNLARTPQYHKRSASTMESTVKWTNRNKGHFTGRVIVPHLSTRTEIHYVILF